MSAILLEFEEGLAVELCSLRGHGMRSGGQGTGAGCAMNVGISSPGINTETSLAYTVICRFLKREKSIDLNDRKLHLKKLMSCPEEGCSEMKRKGPSNLVMGIGQVSFYQLLLSKGHKP